MAIGFVILGARPAEQSGYVVVTVSTPDHGQANITVPAKVAESADLAMVIERMLNNREETKTMLRE